MDAQHFDAIIQFLSAYEKVEPKKLRTSAPAILRSEILQDLLKELLKILKDQPVLLELQPPIKIVSDLHGQFTDLLRILRHSGWPPKTRLLFLGDYVDRGPHGVEVFALLAALKCRFPRAVWLLRGNHESGRINLRYGFKHEIREKYAPWRPVWDHFMEVFAFLPLAALISEPEISLDGGSDEGEREKQPQEGQIVTEGSAVKKVAKMKKRIFAMHGGLSPDLTNFDQIREIQRPLDIPAYGLVCDLTWADPEEGIPGWAENSRNLSFTFGPNVVREFCEKMDVSMIVRGHQVPCDHFPKKYRWEKNKKFVACRGYKFFAGVRLVTLFSVPNYMGSSRNEGAVLGIAPDFTCQFDILKPTFGISLTHKQ